MSDRTRDKQRDRVMLARGWRVARFSGREVINDTFRCVGETLALVTRAA